MHRSRGIWGQPAVFILIVSLISGCSWGRAKRPPMVEGLNVQETPEVILQKPSWEMETRRIRTTAKLLKSEILDREFLYGVDIQNSSMKEGDDFLPAMSLGHYKARFEISGERLQLISDSGALFKSKINHPERLIHEWNIRSSDSTSITVAIDGPSPLLTALLTGPSAPRERTSWLRTAEFDKDSNLLLLQTSIETAQGEVVEFLESLFPRDTLVTDALLKTKAFETPLYMSDEMEPLSKRFGFLSSATVYFDDADGNRQSAMVANRFGWSAKSSKKPIFWYVTPNLPDDLLPVIAAGVEGWNRYSQKMWGKDILRFAGKLPDGIRVGDPRYNVIYWDTVDEAGAAYETQASDPETGIQSHSLIYLPQAWINIGEDAHRKSFPNGDINSDESRRGPRTLLGRNIHARCMRSSLDRPLVHAESLEGISAEDFGKELLKQTLFHEVGHALGMDHNFKGSLAFDPDLESSPPTHSVMDYNDFFVERAVFDSLDSSTGPILEYDRQILSALYNQGQDIASSDPVLPTCNDDDADAMASEGFTRVDPLCNRYDLGNDPTRTLERTLQLITDSDAQVGPILSLSRAMERYRQRLSSKLNGQAAWNTSEQVRTVIRQAMMRLDSLQAQYLDSGHESLIGALGSVRKSLFPFATPLPDEEIFRGRVTRTIDFASSMTALSQTPQQNRKAFVSWLRSWAKATPWARSELASGRSIDSLLDDWLADRSDFSMVRASALTMLRLPPGTTLQFGRTVQGQLDLENWAVGLIFRSLVARQESLGVRRAAAGALATFSGTELGGAKIAEARSLLGNELQSANSTREREALRQLLAALTSSSSKDD